MTGCVVTVCEHGGRDCQNRQERELHLETEEGIRAIVKTVVEIRLNAIERPSWRWTFVHDGNVGGEELVQDFIWPVGDCLF